VKSWTSVSLACYLGCRSLLKDHADRCLISRFKKDMWEKIAKEMQCPWRAAEAMHWQLGEHEMANRANVSVFHLAASNSGGGSGGHPRNSSSAYSSGHSDRALSVSPPMALGMVHGGPAYVHGHAHTHNHGLPQIAMPRSQPPGGMGGLERLSPVNMRGRRMSGASSPSQNGVMGIATPARRRADSARSMPNSSSTSGSVGRLLPPVGDIVGNNGAAPSSQPAVRREWTLPPVMMSGEGSFSR
jgi:hypothetical protein